MRNLGSQQDNETNKAFDKGQCNTAEWATEKIIENEMENEKDTAEEEREQKGKQNESERGSEKAT